MTAKNLERHVTSIRQHQFGRWLDLLAGGDLIPNDHHPEKCLRCVGHPVPDADGQVEKIVLLYGHFLVTVPRDPASLHNEVHLLLGGVADDG